MSTTPEPRPVGRRAFMIAAAGGLAAAGIAATAGPASAKAGTTAPKLPGEISRKANQSTSLKHTPYDNVLVDIGGDRARIFIPQALTVGQAASVPVVWLFHGSGSNQDAMNQGFLWNAEYSVDAGAVAICQNVGGDRYTSDFALQVQKNGVAYVQKLFKIAVSYLRATSGGGALAVAAYGGKLIPKVNGLYLVNGVYDVEKLAQGPGGPEVLQAYGFDTAMLARNNPARIAQSAWARANLRIIVSDDTNPDTGVPPVDHGLALQAKAKPVGRDVSVRTHNLGHTTPSFCNSESMQYFQKWQTAGL